MKIDLNDYELDDDVKNIVESSSLIEKSIGKKINKKPKKFKKDGYFEKGRK